jgi:alkylation response protein AidB-like acyl-CoA dehydrogenase
MGFVQSPPRLGNEYEDDFLLRSYLRQALPASMLAEIESQLLRLGELSGGPLYALQLADRRNEPVHVPYDAWGNRVDRVEPTAVWRQAERVAVEQGIVATPYERRHGRYSRVHGLALAYLFTPSTDFYGCPLAMSDGAVAALLAAGPSPALDRALPHLLARDPALAWTSGQWMTELPGGSDVSRTETVARRDGDGWRLYGRKWFTSAVNSQMALALARPEGAPAGSRGLALFYVETRDADGRLDGIVVERLKDKLGTRKLPTAELTLTGVPALPVGGLSEGVKHIAPMLNVTRTWNAITAAALLGRGLRLAHDYGRRRQAFGHDLAGLPLHADTLLGVEAETAGALLLAFRLAELLGTVEAGPSGSPETTPAGTASVDGSRDEAALLRILTPAAKLTTARQAVAGASELVEAFGGAGYIEDTGIPALLRDAQVLPIWEGTTDLLALDTLRAVEDAGGLAPVVAEAVRCCAHLTDPRLTRVGGAVCGALADAEAWLDAARAAGPDSLQKGARRFALQIGRALELGLLAAHAQAALASAGADAGRRLKELAGRFAAHGVAPIFQEELAASEPAP